MTRDQEKRRDNFMRSARMANVVPIDHFYVTDVFLEKFAEMIAAEEREACAKVCEDHTDRYAGCEDEGHGYEIAAAIRARGET